MSGRLATDVSAVYKGRSGGPQDRRNKDAPEDRFERLAELNPLLGLKHIHDSRFSRYGAVLDRSLYPDLLDAAAAALAVVPPQPGMTRYLASIAALEVLPAVEHLRRTIFAEMPIQTGACWGYNTRLNGVEYHKTSEVAGAVTDLVLMLGRFSELDLSGPAWNSGCGEAFYLPAGTIVELYPETLHLAPCRVGSDTFQAVIILPAGTNTPLDFPAGGSLRMKGKWLIAHPESPAAAAGAHVGVVGVNTEVLPLAD